jgi:hypothetical protein
VCPNTFTASWFWEASQLDCLQGGPTKSPCKKNFFWRPSVPKKHVKRASRRTTELLYVRVVSPLVPGGFGEASQFDCLHTLLRSETSVFNNARKEMNKK